MEKSSGKSLIIYIPINVKVRKKKFNLTQTILNEIEKNSQALESGDIIVISSKYVAMSEGRVIQLSRIVVSQEAKNLSSKLHLSEQVAELVLREADIIYGGVPGYILSIKNHTFTPNSGIDRSNIEKGWAILQPNDPYRKADEIRKQILLLTNKKVGIIFSDSRLLPLRAGTTGIAVGVAGFDSVIDERGKRDLFGNRLRVTRRAIADDISAGAQLLMGESNERTPIVIVRNTGIQIHDRFVGDSQLVIDPDECIYVRGILNKQLFSKMD
jgi:coenzyme F420-0:L-glutamate ligase